MAHKLKLLLFVCLLSAFTGAPACKKQLTANAPPPVAETRAGAEDDYLPQPSDIIPAAPQFKWSWTRFDAAKVAAKKGVAVEQFQKKYLAWNGKFEDYEGRVMYVFGPEDEEEPGRPLHDVQLFLWPAKESGDEAKQRQQLFDYWDKKLAQRYGADFKTEETARTKSHIWHPRPDFAVEIRLVTAADTKPQIGIYWKKEGDEEEEREREKRGPPADEKDEDDK